MINGNVKKPYVWTHAPTGMQFTDKDMYDMACKAWDKRETPRARKERLHREYLQELAKQQAKKDALRSEIKVIESDLELYTKNRDNYAKSKSNLLINQISQYETDIKKMRLALKISKEALKNYIREHTAEYEKENPFPKKKELANLRSKLYKLP